MKSFSVQLLNQWLLQTGFLCDEVDSLGKNRKMPTEQGRNIGIHAEKKMGYDGEYIAVLFDTKAQHFIVDNMQAILNTKLTK